eukprot:scaffold158162_cov39-Prasinocladus_malaysianus.AAC.1
MQQCAAASPGLSRLAPREDLATMSQDSLVFRAPPVTTGNFQCTPPSSSEFEVQGSDNSLRQLQMALLMGDSPRAEDRLHP